MKWAVVGAGAMGSLFVSHLARAGAEVWACDPWKEHVAAMRERGLRVLHEGADSVLHPRATSDPAEAGIADVVIVFVKYNQTRDALRSARPLVGPQTILLTLQNGLGNVELIREAFPDNRVLFGFTTLTSELLGPGHIEASYAGRGETYFWPADGQRDAGVEAVREGLEAAGIHSLLEPRIELMIWKKLIVNCCLNTVCAVTGLPVGKLCDRPESWPLLEGLADEIVAVASRRKIPLDRAQAHTFLRSVAEEARGHYPSMLVDVKHRRQTEIECLNGAVLREAERLGIDAPMNRAIYSLIRVLESSYA
jgi:2-dehydropantoate 2-reductase